MFNIEKGDDFIKIITTTKERVYPALIRVVLRLAEILMHL